MTEDPIRKKCIDIMGNNALDSLQKAHLLLQTIRSNVDPDQHPQYIRLVLESYGLVPRHTTEIEGETFDPQMVERVQKSAHEKVQYEIKGWFEVNIDRPIEKTLIEICCFLEEWVDEKEKAVIFDQILTSSYIPIRVNFFSRFIDEDNDNLILREHADTYIQMRQMLNLQIGPTSRGSLLLEFLKPLETNPKAQAVILGAFVEELLRRLKSKSTQDKSNIFSGSIPLGMDFNPDNMKEMMERMQSMIPPEVLDQLRKLFSQDDDEDDPLKP